MKENLHTKLIESLVNKKFKYWKEEFVKKLKENLDSYWFEEDDVYDLTKKELHDLIDKLACLSSKENLK